MELNINIEEIEQYLAGALEGKALEDFEQRLKSDAKLAARVKLMQKLDPVLEDEKALEVQKTVLNLGAEFFSEETTEEESNTIVRRIPLYRRPLAIAAAILLLIAIGFVIQMQMGGSLSNQELYATYYQPYEANDLSRGEVVEDGLYRQAIEKYSAKEYMEAFKLFQQIIEEDPEDIQAKFALAHTCLNKKPADPNQAARYFQEVITDGKSILVPKAKWNLALIYLKSDNIDTAKGLLQEVMDSEDDKLAAKAKELLEKIE